MRIPICVAAAAAVLAVGGRSSAQPRSALSSEASTHASADSGARTFFLAIESRRPEIASLSIIDDEILRLTEQSTLRMEVAGRVVAASAAERGGFVGVMTLTPDKSDEYGLLQLVLTDEYLNPIFRKELPYSKDAPIPSLIVASDGSAVVSYHERGQVEFLSATGEVVTDVEVTSGSHDIERIVLAGNAVSTGRIAVVVNEPVVGGELSVAAGRVRLFTAFGEEESGFDVPRRTVTSLGLSPSGDVIALGSHDITSGSFETTFFNGLGGTLHRIDFAAEHVKFDARGQYVAARDKKQIAIVDPFSGTTLLRHRLENDSLRLLDIDISRDGDYAVALAGRTRFTDRGFVHDQLRLHEFVREPDGSWTTYSRDLDTSAVSARVVVEEPGIAVALDGLVLLLDRE
jgi:hypothetical protein